MQCDDSTNITSDDETSKRSVRFTESVKDHTVDHTLHDRDCCDGDDGGSSIVGNEKDPTSQNNNEDDDHSAAMQPGNELIALKKHSSIFHNALRPNSAVRQLFPAPVPAAPLTHEALMAFEEAKRTHISAPVVAHNSDTETDTIRRTIERNALRRSLIKYEPK